MSLDIALIDNGEYVWEGNITHNLCFMADRAGIYDAVWRPEEDQHDAVSVLEEVALAVDRLLLNRAYYEQDNPENGWGNYDTLVRFLVDYALALNKFPYAKIKVSR